MMAGENDPLYIGTARPRMFGSTARTQRDIQGTRSH